MGNFCLRRILDQIIFSNISYLIRAMNKIKKKEEAAPPAPPKPSAEETLLSEIRDLLKGREAAG